MAAGHEMFGGGSHQGVPMISNDVAGRDDELVCSPAQLVPLSPQLLGAVHSRRRSEQTHAVGGHSNAGGSAQPSITPIAGDQLVFEQSECAYSTGNER